MPKIPLIGPSGRGRSFDQNNRRLVNTYLETDADGGKEQVYGVGRMGTKEFATTSAAIRGHPIVFGDYAYYVAGDTFYQLSSDGTETSKGTLTSNSGYNIGMVRNRSQILIVDGTQEMFVYYVLAMGGVAAGTFATVGYYSTEVDVTAITVADAPTHKYNVAAEDHGGATNDYALLAGTTNFNGVYQITKVDADNFTIIDADDPAAEPTLTAATAQMRSNALTIQPTQCAYMDGYGIVTNARTNASDAVHPGQWYISAADDFSTWDATDVAVAQRNPDDLLALRAVGGDLQLYGAESLEHYYNAGSTDNPFEPTRAAATPWGIEAPWTLAEVGDGTVWVGRRPNGTATVLLMEGYLPREIASRAVLYRLSQATSAQRLAATAFSFRDEGHDFYVLAFASETWVYDHAESARIGTPVWSEWTTYNGTTYVQFLGKWYVNAWGKHLVSDRTNARLLELDHDTYVDTEAGTSRAVQRLLVTGYVKSEDKAMFHSRVYVDMEHSGTGSLLLESSDDGGDTWADHGSFTLSSTDARPEWFQLGLARTDRVYRLTTTDAMKFVILAMYLDAEPGEH